MAVSGRAIPILPLLLLLLCSRRPAALSPDGLSLLAFKSAVASDPTSALADWDPRDAHPCRWSGVSCAAVPGSSTPRVVSVAVSARNLSGYIPSELGTLLFLRRLDFHGNLLSGSVPPRLSNASSLRSIFLYSNNLTGRLPPEFCHLPRLRNLDLSRNRLSGEISSGIRNCGQLQRLVLRNNRLSGVVPAGIWSELKSLMELDLSSNDFSGPIPPDLGEMKSMTRVMNLSCNRFSGEIPTSLGKLPTGVTLDFRSNDLSGEIPRNGELENQAAISFLENPDLCGVPLPITCKHPASTGSWRNQRAGGGREREVNNSNTDGNVGKRKGLGTSLVVMIVAVDAVGIALIGLLVLYVYSKAKDQRCTDTLVRGPAGGERTMRSLLCFRSRGGRHDDDRTASTTSPGGAGEEERGALGAGGRLVAMDRGLEVQLEELLGASAYVLGSGASGGMVYKVVLGDGAAVAVRTLGEVGAAGGGKYKEFAAEAQAIARVRHPNVVSLRAFYWSHEEKLIVSDYVANGNLASALRGRSGRRPHLSWAARLRIAGGTARGLAYLHECSPRKLVHGNIKPSNVLLDHDFNPRISDFGLARLVAVSGDASVDVTGVSLPHLRSGPIRRPNNYQAPEARLTMGRPTQKWDVYSFGVILLEMVTGRSPELSATSSPMEAGELVRWARNGFDADGMLTEIADGGILRECSHAKKDVAAAVQVALACTETDPESRPKMKAVCDKLEKIGRR